MPCNKLPLTLTLSSGPLPYYADDTNPDSTDEPSTIRIPLSLTLANTSTDTAYTILTWSSPLDPLVFPLGLLSLAVLDATGKETSIPINRIMLRRRTPPGPESYVVIEPGQSFTRTVVCRLEPPGVDVKGEEIRGKVVRVRWVGREGGGGEGFGVTVWEGRRESVADGGNGEGPEGWDGLSGGLEWTVNDAVVDVVACGGGC